VSELYEALADAIRTEQPAALAEIVEGPDDLLGQKLLVRPGPPVQVLGSLGDPDLDRVVIRDVEGELAAGLTATRHYGQHGEARARDVSVFIESFAPPPRMIIFGAVDFTAALAKVAKVLGYRVTVCDARPVFATRTRFPMADEVVVAWPDRHLAEVGGQLGPRDAVCVLTHDPKFDVPAVVAALATNVGYLGAMGSRRTTEDREARLREAGVDDNGLARVMGPIGLDIGARTPEETAVAICAEIIALRTGKHAPSLRDQEGPIHHDLQPVGPGETAAEGT
jgi:xanthine dehydrogenase accessory factor